MKKDLIFIIIFICICIFAILWFKNYNIEINNQISEYLKTLEKTERAFIENFPIYEDYITPEKEKKLRKFLIKYHLEIAKKHNIKPVNTDAEIITRAGNGELVKLQPGTDDLYYFYNVPEKYRYLSPYAVSGLKKLTEKFQENIVKRKNLPPVKIAISSAIRPEEYQKNLIKKNINASIISSHKFGISYDVFYDDYYIVLPEPETDNDQLRISLEKIRRKFGFVLGDSLRRQFRSILAESLLQLQEEKILYVIHEKNQRCYHVTIIF